MYFVPVWSPYLFDSDKLIICAYTFQRFSVENKHLVNEYAYLPFGLGPRNCIGLRLAQLEVKMTMASILRRYKIHKTDQLEVLLYLIKHAIETS